MRSFCSALLMGASLLASMASGQDSQSDGVSTFVRTHNALGISGDRFTIGGQPVFLLGVSYFDALGWRVADLDALQARRFNLIRIFLDWSILEIKDGVPSPLAPRGFLNSDGSLKNTEALLNLVRACAARGIMVDVTILTALFDASNPTSTILDMQSRERAVRNAVRLLKHEPNVFFDVCNEHDVAWNGKTTTLTHAEVATLIRAALSEHADAIVTVSSGGGHLPNARNTREELEAGVMLIAPHFQRDSDWFDRTDDRVKSVKEHIKSAGRNVPVYLQEEQRRGWTKVSPPKSEFLQAAREARDAGAAGWVFHTHAGFDLRSSNFLANLDSVEREVLDSLSTQVYGAVPAPAEESRVLRVHPTNPRYFTDGIGNPDGSLRAVYLTGSHTWNNRLDMGRDDPPKAFDFDAYLDFLVRHDHNFIRLWVWASTTWDTRSALAWVEKGALYHVAPQPWPRTGPGLALDGKPKFNLEKFDPAYFERLRARVQAAGQRGIYVSVMLFEGWTLSSDATSWNGHPFRKENNVQGIDGDPNGDGKGLEIQTLTLPRVTRLQEAYVRKVIDTVNDLENVLYEIANEARLLNPASSTKEWQYHLIRFIKNEEASRPKQHPVGMTSQGGGGGDDSAILRNSPADWISPNSDKFDYKDNPPANDTGKVVLLDTDHLWGVGGDAAWVWKSFLRGHNPLFMDPYDHLILGKGSPGKWEGARQALGATRRLAARMDLASMTPLLDLASTKYCLARPGHEYLIYQPGTGEFSMNLTAGSYAFEWFNPTTGSVASKGSVKAAGGNQTFTPPFSGPAVLYLKVASAKPRAASSITPAPTLESSAKQMTNDGPKEAGQKASGRTSVRFFVDSRTNSDDPEQRMAYGLNVTPPWPEGGSVFINLPEHLEYMPGTHGIARHHDARRNVWQVSPDGTEARYAVESLSEPGVFFGVRARAGTNQAFFQMSITNRTAKTLKSIRPLLCFQYHSLKGFPAANSDNFTHTFVVLGGKPVSVGNLPVKNPQARARMAQVDGCADEHNWWAEKLGGMIEQRLDGALTILTAREGDRKIAVRWHPGKNFLSNRAIPCLHADPCIGDLAPGETRTVQGELLFTRASLEQIVSEANVEALPLRAGKAGIE